eukprot:823901-Prorocentrum_minimum.AAC.1
MKPPAAFKRKGDLSAADGRVVLCEHSEEHPLLVNLAGMGARLVRYYQKVTHPTGQPRRDGRPPRPYSSSIPSPIPSPIPSRREGATQPRKS